MPLKLFPLNLQAFIADSILRGFDLNEEPNVHTRVAEHQNEHT
jgi:hypothetical protein